MALLSRLQFCGMRLRNCTENSSRTSWLFFFCGTSRNGSRTKPFQPSPDTPSERNGNVTDVKPLIYRQSVQLSRQTWLSTMSMKINGWESRWNSLFATRRVEGWAECRKWDINHLRWPEMSKWKWFTSKSFRSLNRLTCIVCEGAECQAPGTTSQRCRIPNNVNILPGEFVNNLF